MKWPDDYMNTIIQGDALAVLRDLPDESFDAVVTDPPYGLSFMGKKWDYDVPGVAEWVECLRVLKPGGHLLSFFGTRTYHRGVVNIEDAGFEIRDQLAWVYGSGFPKSLDVSKAIDKAAGAEREVIGTNKRSDKRGGNYHGASEIRPQIDCLITLPATDTARQWNGWGTALKPAWEPIVLARKPIEGTVAANVLEHGTGALNVDGCRVGIDDGTRNRPPASPTGKTYAQDAWTQDKQNKQSFNADGLGRFPANLIHDGGEEVLGMFPQGKSGTMKAGTTRKNRAGFTGNMPTKAARFFYCAKASRSERGEGNDHPTVKPLALMRYLCRLITPPGGVILDPYCGSGSACIAAHLEGFRFLAIDKEQEYIEIAERRLAKYTEQHTLDLGN